MEKMKNKIKYKNLYSFKKLNMKLIKWIAGLLGLLSTFIIVDKLFDLSKLKPITTSIFNLEIVKENKTIVYGFLILIIFFIISFLKSSKFKKTKENLIYITFILFFVANLVGINMLQHRHNKIDEVVEVIIPENNLRFETNYQTDTINYRFTQVTRNISNKIDSIIPIFANTNGNNEVFGVAHVAGYRNIDLYYINSPEKIEAYKRLQTLTAKEQLRELYKFIKYNN